MSTVERGRDKSRLRGRRARLRPRGPLAGGGRGGKSRPTPSSTSVTCSRTGDANSVVGPANVYPATIEVPAYPALITKVTATVIDLGSGEPEDIDMALVGPDGTTVMLMSDACGKGGLQDDNWTFDDEAPTFLSRLGCGSGEDASFKPTNYFEEATPDDMVVDGVGPAGPFHKLARRIRRPDPRRPLEALRARRQRTGGRLRDRRLVAHHRRRRAEPAARTARDDDADARDRRRPRHHHPGGHRRATPAGGSDERTGRRAAALAKCKKKSPGKPRRRCRAHAHNCRSERSVRRAGRRRELRPRGDVELAIGVGEVHLDRPQGDEELLADLAVGRPGCRRRGDPLLGRGQRLRPERARRRGLPPATRSSSPSLASSRWAPQRWAISVASRSRSRPSLRRFARRNAAPARPGSAPSRPAMGRPRGAPPSDGAARSPPRRRAAHRVPAARRLGPRPRDPALRPRPSSETFL